MEQFFNAVDKLIVSADKLGSLSTAAILAFFCMLFIFYIIYLLRQQKIGSELAWQARFKEAEADNAMSSAIEHGFEAVNDKLVRIESELRLSQVNRNENRGDKHV